MQSVQCSVFTSAQRRDDIDGEQSIVVHSTVERRDDIGELMCFSSQCSLFSVHSRVHRGYWWVGSSTVNSQCVHSTAWIDDIFSVCSQYTAER